MSCKKAHFFLCFKNSFLFLSFKKNKLDLPTLILKFKNKNNEKNYNFICCFYIDFQFFSESR